MQDAEKTTQKQHTAPGRPFPKGSSGNPSGRPRGSRNRVTLALESLLEGEGEAIVRKCIERAKKGNPVALRVLVERLLPKDRRVRFRFDVPATMAEAPQAIGSVLTGVSRGELTPAEGQAVVNIIAAQVRAFEGSELAQQLDELRGEVERVRSEPHGPRRAW